MIIYAFLLSLPASILSVLTWRLRNPILFWIALVFVLLLIALYAFNLQHIYSSFLDIDSMLYGLFLLCLLGVPLFFLIASQIKPSGLNESDVTDDYLNSIIESKDEEIDFE